MSTSHPHHLTYEQAKRLLWCVLWMLIAAELLVVLHLVATREMMSACAILIARVYDTLRHGEVHIIGKL